MIFKILGAATVIFCGVLYAKNAQRGIGEELAEAERLLGVFKYVKNEIAEFDTPLYSVLKSRGIEGGIDGLLSGISSKKLREAVAEAKKLGRSLIKSLFLLPEFLKNLHLF